MPCSTALSSRSIAASSSGVPCTFGPVNHFFPLRCQYPNTKSAESRISGPVKLKLLTRKRPPSNSFSGPQWWAGGHTVIATAERLGIRDIATVATT